MSCRRLRQLNKCRGGVMLRVLWLAGGIRRCKPDFADSNLAKLCQSDGRSTAGAHSFTS